MRSGCPERIRERADENLALFCCLPLSFELVCVFSQTQYKAYDD